MSKDNEKKPLPDRPGEGNQEPDERDAETAKKWFDFNFNATAYHYPCGMCGEDSDPSPEDLEKLHATNLQELVDLIHRVREETDEKPEPGTEPEEKPEDDAPEPEAKPDETPKFLVSNTPNGTSLRMSTTALLDGFEDRNQAFEWLLAHFDNNLCSNRRLGWEQIERQAQLDQRLALQRAALLEVTTPEHLKPKPH